MRKPIQIVTVSLVFLMVLNLNAQVEVVNNGILTVKEGQLVQINGNLSNFSSSFTNQGDIGLTGNFLNEARVTNPGMGIFRFLGMEEQFLTAFDTLEMFNVEIDNPAGLTLDGITNLRIHGDMSFWDGIVNTNQESMLSFREGATTSNGNTFSHINGPALKSGLNDFVFPLGKDGDYRPAAISDLNNPSTFQMEYIHYPYFNYTQEFEVLKVNDEGYWDLQRIEGLFYPKLSLTYDESTNIFSSSNNLEIVHWDDLWKILPSESDGATPVVGLTTQNRIGDYGFFTTAQRRSEIPDASAINISQNEECEIVIDWIMPPGTLIAKYEIEYSYDSLEFVYTGEVEGDTTALTTYRTYRFVDQNLHEASKIYYRIKLVATGPWGAFTYSPVVSIENDCPFEECKIYPNPVLNNQNLKFQVTSEAETEMPLKIWDVVGRLMFEQTLELDIGQRIYEINTADHRLVAGTYILEINPRKSLKFIVVQP